MLDVQLDFLDFDSIGTDHGNCLLEISDCDEKCMSLSMEKMSCSRAAGIDGREVELEGLQE